MREIAMMKDTSVLAWSAILTFLMLATASLLRSQGWTTAGMRIAFGNRDDLLPATPVAGRAERAARNMVENLVLLIALIAAARFAGRAGPHVDLGATLFFWARVAYWPCYLAGVIYLRTALWLISILGLGMTAVALL
jgi:uncharacterized MAPEG superfamily protein